MEMMEKYYKLALENTKKFQKATQKEQTSMLEQLEMTKFQSSFPS
jgi:hypothetical protein